jgi:hypothetical protein
VKGKVVPLYVMVAPEGREVQLLLVLNLGSEGGEWSASRLGHSLHPGKGSSVPIVRVLDGVQRVGEESIAFVRDRTPAVRSVIRHCSY